MGILSAPFVCVRTALAAYEHILTAHQEYQVIWKRKVSVPMILFVINRYLLLVHGFFYLLWYLVWWQSDLVSALALRCIDIYETIMIRHRSKRYAKGISRPYTNS